LVTLDYPERSRDSKTNSISLKKAKSTGQDRNPYPDIIQAPRRIDAVNSLYPDADVWMKAGHEVQLLPGFHAYYGSSLHAYIDPALDMYPVYFTKTTNDPCGQRDYYAQHLLEEDIPSALEQCRQNLISYHEIDRDSISKFSTSQLRVKDEAGLIEKDELNPYPNPSNGTFFVELHDDSGVKQIELFNSIGVIIDNCNPIISGKNEIDLRNFQSGVYYLRIISDETVKIYKLVKE